MPRAIGRRVKSTVLKKLQAETAALSPTPQSRPSRRLEQVFLHPTPPPIRSTVRGFVRDLYPVDDCQPRRILPLPDPVIESAAGAQRMTRRSGELVPRTREFEHVCKIVESPIPLCPCVALTLVKLKPLAALDRKGHDRLASWLQGEPGSLGVMLH